MNRQNERRRRGRKKPQASRQPKVAVMLVVQGTVTEKEYFKQLRSKWRIPNLKVVAIAESPECLVDSTLRRIGRDNDEQVAEVFFVVDVDDTSDEKFQRAFQSAKSASSDSTRYRFVVSNESFETWLLSHVQDIRGRNIGRKEIQHTLKKKGYLVGRNGKSLGNSFPFCRVDEAMTQVDLCDYNQVGKVCSTAVPHLIRYLRDSDPQL